MDTTLVLVLSTLTLTLGVVALQALRLGNERRDVALLAALGGLFGVGTAVAVI